MYSGNRCDRFAIKSRCREEDDMHNGGVALGSNVLPILVAAQISGIFYCHVETNYDFFVDTASNTDELKE